MRKDGPLFAGLFLRSRLLPYDSVVLHTSTHDRFGNRWQQNPGGFSTTFTGNNPTNPQNNNRIDGYSYDAAGNLLSDGVNTYTYDAENRISTYRNTGGATASYVYDAFGQRVEKTSSGPVRDGTIGVARLVC